jgi:hypothetical protein
MHVPQAITHYLQSLHLTLSIRMVKNWGGIFNLNRHCKMVIASALNVVNLHVVEFTFYKGDPFGSSVDQGAKVVPV